MRIAVLWICCVEGGTSGGWERFICGGSGTGIALAGYESRYSRRVCCEEGGFFYRWYASYCIISNN